jgi:putative membrane protein
MKDIHAKDGAAFAKEASGGSNPALKAFAAETHAIVLMHIGELSGAPAAE